jgi:tetratricopeptide (TPR) repeat protein
MQYLATGEYKDVQNIRSIAQRRLVMHWIEEHKPAEAYDVVIQAKKKDPLLTFSTWAADVMRPVQGPQAQNIQTLYGEKGKKALPVIAAETVAFIEKQPTTDPAQKSLVDHWCARIFANAGVIDKATERFAALLKAHPEDDTMRSEYGAHLRDSHKFSEARLVFHEMKDAYTADREIAETYLEEGDVKSCIESFQAMLGKHPDKVGEIQWRLGEVLQKHGRYQEAIAAFQQSQRDPQALFQVAECQGRLKQNDAAIQTLMGIVNFFTSSAPEAQYRIASQYAAKGDKEAAIRTLKNVCKVYLNTPQAGKAHQDLSITYGVDVTLGGASKKDDQ